MKVELKAAKFYDGLIDELSRVEQVERTKNNYKFKWQEVYEGVAGGDFGG